MTDISVSQKPTLAQATKNSNRHKKETSHSPLWPYFSFDLILLVIFAVDYSLSTTTMSQMKGSHFSFKNEFSRLYKPFFNKTSNNTQCIV